MLLSSIRWSDHFLSQLWEPAINSKYRSADINYWPTLICLRCNNDRHQPIIHQNHLLISHPRKTSWHKLVRPFFYLHFGNWPIPSKYRSADPNHWPTLICFRCNNDHHQPIIHQNHLLIYLIRGKLPGIKW
ncbi:hypothetical protein CEXT_22611 [Caerostris extrusa]|uniref:Uncharacterized protein n=1 Tax=Caerostris extrusa TaxID=172846 RepID=A0AAV4MI97_CAEEX|nr:hypothetical protein CEXT_22611 [Caerostris extrusa]